jgi:hypothetical protein
VTVIVKVWFALVSTPPFAVPPLSVIGTLNVGARVAFAARVYVGVPVAAIAGGSLFGGGVSVVSL